MDRFIAFASERVGQLIDTFSDDASDVEGAPLHCVRCSCVGTHNLRGAHARPRKRTFLPQVVLARAPGLTTATQKIWNMLLRARPLLPLGWPRVAELRQRQWSRLHRRRQPRQLRRGRLFHPAPLSMRVTAATPAVHDDCCCRRDCRVRVPCQMYIGSLLTCELLRAFGYISELFSKALLLLRCARMRRLLKARQPLRWQQPEIRKMIPAGAPRYTAQAGTQGAHRPAVAPDFRVLIVVHVRARHPGLPKEPLRRR